MADFTDPATVSGLLQIDRGALDALIDNPLLLTEPDENAYFHQAVIRGVSALRKMRDRVIPGHAPLLRLAVEKVEVQGVEVSYPAWEVSVAGPEADAMLTIHREQGEAIKVCEALHAVLVLVLGAEEVERV